MDRHLLEDDKPSNYFISIDKPEFSSEFPFSMLNDLKITLQSPVYHPEGTVWNHIMLVIDEAAQRRGNSSDARAFMWAALLHDIGKKATTRSRKGKITSYNHDKLGSEMARAFLGEFTQDKEMIKKVAALVRWHMQVLFVAKSTSLVDIKSMKEQTSIPDIALLGLCDRLGRLDVDKEKEEKNIKTFLEICS